MLAPSNNKTVLWVSKESPPMIIGAHFDAYKSGRTAVAQWKANNYVLVMVESGVMEDGLTGFDVIRNIRARNDRAVVYLMAVNTSGPENILAKRLRVNGFIRKSTTEIQSVLRQSNAINWGDRPGRKKSESSLTQRIFNFWKSDKPADISPKKVDVIQLEVYQLGDMIKEQKKATVLVDDVLTDISNLDVNIVEEKQTKPLSNEDFIATAGLSQGVQIPLEEPAWLRQAKKAQPTQQAQSTCISTISPTTPSTNLKKVDTITSSAERTNMTVRNANDINMLNFTKLGSDFEEIDRQFAWELYTELSTRVAVTGKSNNPTCTNVDGELWTESFSSLLAFCKELRVLLRSFPANEARTQAHLGSLMLQITRVVLNPFLDKWRVDYLQWWEYQSDKNKAAVERQMEYPKSQQMLVEWRELKMMMRAIQETIARVYKL